MPRALEILDVTLRETTTLEAIDLLLTEELTLRENRRVKMAFQMARLSAIKTLAGFDFSFPPSLDSEAMTHRYDAVDEATRLAGRQLSRHPLIWR